MNKKQINRTIKHTRWTIYKTIEHAKWNVRWFIHEHEILWKLRCKLERML